MSPEDNKTATPASQEGSVITTRSIDDEIRDLEAGLNASDNHNVLGAKAPSHIGVLETELNRLDHPEVNIGVPDIEFISSRVDSGPEDLKRSSEVAQLKSDIDMLVSRLDARSDPSYKGVMEVIDKRLDEAIASGYSLDYIYKSIDFVFGPYAMNGINESSPNEWYEKRISSEFDAMGIVGGASMELATLTQGDNILTDYVMQEIAFGIRNGEKYDTAIVRESLNNSSGKLEKIKKDQPDLYEALIHTDIRQCGDIETVNSYANFGMRTAPYLPFLREQTGMSSEQLLRVLGNEYRGIDKETGQFSENIYRSIEDYKFVVDAGIGFSTKVLADIFLGNVNQDHSIKVRDYLTSDYFKDIMSDELTAHHVNRALSSMTFLMDKFDIAKDIEILHSVDHAPDDYLNDLIYADADLSGDGKQTFYDIGVHVLSRTDKDGNLYDSPRILSKAIKDHTGELQKDVEFKWFIESGLPIAAIDMVAHFHTDALEAGIEDSPKSIYEWIRKDPNKTAELSRIYLTDYIAGISEGADSDTVALLIEQAERLVDTMSEDFRVFVNISSESLKKVVDNGGSIRSTFDASVGQKGIYNSNYMQVRSGVEIALGIRSLDGNEEHPIYGTAGYVGNGVPNGAIGYGEIMVSYKFDESLSSRTSFTPEDSFHGAHRLTARDAQITRVIKTGVGMEDTRTKEYVEAQVVGGLSVDDIDAVYVSSASMIDDLPDKLRSKAIVRETRNDFTVPAYKGRRERQLYESVMKRNVPNNREGV